MNKDQIKKCLYNISKMNKNEILVNRYFIKKVSTESLKLIEEIEKELQCKMKGV